MARKLCIFAAAMTASGIGAFLVAGRGRSTFGMSWTRLHLEVVQEELADLKAHLLEFKQTHGRYPTNDEGLAALDNFEARFTMTLDFDKDPYLGEGYRAVHRRDHMWRRDLQGMVEMCREEYGHVPQSADEFRRMGIHSWLVKPQERRDLPRELEVAITRSNHILLIGPGGVLSPWRVPYVYENRIGLNEAVFAGSPANRGRKRRYSLRVDDGVWLYAVGGEVLSERLDAQWWEYYGPALMGAGLLVAAAMLLLCLARSSRKAAAVGLAAAVGSALVGFSTPPSVYVMCYAPRSPFESRRPQVVEQQRELLERFHSRGVISDETYAKALSALAPEPSNAEAQDPPAR